jgi:hypothetical protein
VEEFRLEGPVNYFHDDVLLPPRLSFLVTAVLQLARNVDLIFIPIFNRPGIILAALDIPCLQQFYQ